MNPRIGDISILIEMDGDTGVAFNTRYRLDRDDSSGPIAGKRIFFFSIRTSAVHSE